MSDQSDIRLLYEAFFAIAESYTTIVYADTETDTAHAIRLDDFSKRYEEILDSGKSIKEIFGRYINETVAKDDASAIKKYADIAYVKEKLKESAVLYHIYRTVHGETIMYYRLKIIAIEDGKKLIYGFENIDNQYRRQIEIQADREKMMMLFDGLAREYMSVWYLDGKSRKVKLMKNNGSDSENGDAVRIGNTMVDYHFSMQRYFGDFVSPEDFDRLMEETAYETLVKKVREDELYCVNYIRINQDQSKNHFQACYAKMVDNTGIASFVLGFRKIDTGE